VKQRSRCSLGGRDRDDEAQREVDVPRMLDLLGIDYEEHHDELWACCPHPAHEEKTASWSIKSTGQHHCFGCKWGGGPLELIRQNMDLAGWAVAREWLEEHGLYKDGALPLNVRLLVTRPDLELVQVEVPPDARFISMDKWVTPARRYAVERGVTESQVDRWGLGYAAGGYYANRLLLPTRARDGRIINITGRAWSSTKTPKYLNSKEQHGWDASAIFGEQFWPQHCGDATLVLNEGELNSLACERVGAMFVGALGGSTLEKEQVLKFSSFKTVILATDIDKAGSEIAAQLRATLIRWRTCRRVDFPDRRDPNDLERQNPELLKSLLWGKPVQVV